MKTLSIADNSDITLDDYLLANESSKEETTLSDRIHASPLLLIVRAIGTPRVVAGKLWRLAVSLFNTFYLGNQRKRLQRLKDIGFIEKSPSQLQLWFGAYDMMRYFISPGAASYYRKMGINFTFHQVLRFLNDPSGLIDPIGIRVSRDAIICHLLEVVHANPVYDLQLLEQFPDGLDALEQQIGQMLDGTHPRHRSIMAITEEAGYHANLLQYLKRYRLNPNTKQMVRSSGDVRSDPHFLMAECTFGTLPSAFRYFNRLPSGLLPLLRHARSNKVINPVMCDAWIVEQFRSKGLVTD